jgi:hypothetical protein
MRKRPNKHTQKSKEKNLVRKTNSQALKAFAALHLGEKKIRVRKTPISSIILACLLSVKEDSDEKNVKQKYPKV